MPRMAIWRTSDVLQILEMLLFKFAKKGAGDASAALAEKARAVRAFGALGIESTRVVQLLIRAYEKYPELLHDIILSVKEIATTSLSVIPLLYVRVCVSSLLIIARLSDSRRSSRATPPSSRWPLPRRAA